MIITIRDSYRKTETKVRVTKKYEFGDGNVWEISRRTYNRILSDLRQNCSGILKTTPAIYAYEDTWREKHYYIDCNSSDCRVL